MDLKKTNIKERILYLAEKQKVSKDAFISELGMTYSSFKGKQKETSLNSDAIEKLIDMYPDVDANWLITGEGSIFKEKSNSFINQDLEIIELKKELEICKKKLEILKLDDSITDIYERVTKIEKVLNLE